MCDILALAMLIFGIITLVTGKFRVTGSKTVYGAPARIVGAIMLLPLPLLLVVGVALGFGMLARGQQINLDDANRLQTLGLILGVGVVGGCFALAMVVAWLNAEPTRVEGRRPRDDDDYPRRRRRDDDYDDDERRPRRSREDDYDDDRPRRRPDDEGPPRRDPDERIR